MTESFAEMLEESITIGNFRSGEIIKASVLKIDEKSQFVIVNGGLKSESWIQLKEFAELDGNINIKEGDTVDVFVENIEDGEGRTILSRQKAKEIELWSELNKAMENKDPVLCKIMHEVHGGYIIQVQSIKGFLPTSLLDTPAGSNLEGQTMQVKILKMNEAKNNILVSRKAMNENSFPAISLDKVETGDVVKGIVKNITNYGAFIDLGGLDGLLHITDIAWQRVENITDYLNVGDEIDVKIIKLNKEKQRVSLGLKQLNDDPWILFNQTQKVGDQLSGTVTKVEKFGAFVVLDSGIEGLIHSSEIQWQKGNINPNDFFAVGDKVDVVIVDINDEKHSISLSSKRLKESPWIDFKSANPPGTKIKASVKLVADFGLVVLFENGLDALVHFDELNWSLGRNDPKTAGYATGDELEVVIKEVDTEKERISASIKELTENPAEAYVAKNNIKEGDVIEGTISAIQTKAIIVNIDNDVEGLIVASQADIGRKELNKEFKVGEKVSASFVKLGDKGMKLSIRDMNDAIKEDIKKHSKSGDKDNTSVGELIKGAIEEQN